MFFWYIFGMEKHHIFIKSVWGSSGVYIIKNNITNNLYIGESNNVGERVWNHLRSLMNKSYRIKSFQEDFDKYGIESFCFSFFEENDEINRIKKEKELALQHKNNLYSKFISGNLTREFALTEQQVQKIVECRNNEKLSWANIAIKLNKEFNLNYSFGYYRYATLR